MLLVTINELANSEQLFHNFESSPADYLFIHSSRSRSSMQL